MKGFCRVASTSDAKCSPEPAQATVTRVFETYRYFQIRELSSLAEVHFLSIVVDRLPAQVCNSVLNELHHFFVSNFSASHISVI